MKMNLVVLRQYFDEEEPELISINRAIEILQINYPRLSRVDLISGLLSGQHYQTPGAVYWGLTRY